ncbi:hypothetical protein O1L55_20635 [Streptomyces albulus]|nr:hypothetical protein [Streptomyces noursei]
MIKDFMPQVANLGRDAWECTEDIADVAVECCPEPSTVITWGDVDPEHARIIAYSENSLRDSDNYLKGLLELAARERAELKARIKALESIIERSGLLAA